MFVIFWMSVLTVYSVLTSGCWFVVMKGVLLDQFGVLHDGRAPYPGAIDAVKALHEAGLKIVLLSNSSQRAVKVYDRLEGLGFQRQWIAGVS